MEELDTTTATEETALRSLLGDATTLAAAFLEGLPERRVTPTATAAELREELGGSLPDGPLEPRRVLAELARDAEPGLMATPGGRFFGFVIGGSLPAALAADWLAQAWDQNAGLYVAAPAASVFEKVCGAWLAELFGLPLGISFGHVTGGQRDALMISAASVVVLGSGILPRWLALVGFLAAILALLHFLLALIGAVSGLVWITLASALMLAGLSQGTPAPRRPARR